ncbi:MAG: SRPBCC domain-containing protein [bacterium]
MPQIQQIYHIKAPIEKVWDALTNPQTMSDWDAGPEIVMELKLGGKFSLWGGDIHGTNTMIDAPNRLKQDWFGGDWPLPSKVVFKLSQKGKITTVRLTHDNLPTAEVGNFYQGWKDYYLGPIQRLLQGD